MHLTRRQFTLLSLGAAAGAALGPGAVRALARAAEQAPETPLWLEWSQVAPGAHVAMGEGGNSLIIASAGESLLVDAKNTGFGAALRREARAVGAADVVRLVNTHHHADHTGGNSAFADLPVLAHENAPERVRAQFKRYTDNIVTVIRMPRWQEKPALALLREDIAALGDQLDDLAPDDFAPNETIGAEKELRIGGLAVELRHVGAGHTDNDVFVRVPELNVVHTGDLLFRTLHPFIDLSAGATIDGWQKSLDAIAALCDDQTVVVPGHGPVTNLAGLREQREYFDILRRYIKQGVELGLDRDDITRLDMPELTAYGFERLKPQNVGIVYDDMMRE